MRTLFYSYSVFLIDAGLFMDDQCCKQTLSILGFVNINISRHIRLFHQLH